MVGLSQVSHAYESTGYLKDIFVNKDGLVLFRLTNPVHQRPKCANNPDWDYKLDLSMLSSKAMFELLQLAELTSKPIRVGYGAEPNCGDGFPAIDTHYVLFNNFHEFDKAKTGNYVNGE
ncbi:MAG: hypothetical protein ACI845_003054 [Gammaproteobacteria bacterium]